MMLHRLADRLAGARIPDPRRLVLRCSDQKLARRIKGYRRDGAIVHHRLADRFTGPRVPQP